MKGALLLAVFLSGSEAIAGSRSCDTVDLRQQSTLLLQARNQGKSEWCYAYAAADLLSYRLGEEVSASDVALNYTDGVLNSMSRRFAGRSELDAKGGFIEGALQATLKKGLCLERQFHSDDYAGFTRDGDMVIRKMDEQIRALEKNAGLRQQISDILATPSLSESERCREIALVPGLKEARALFPLLSFVQSVTTFLDSKASNVVRNYQAQACHDRRALPKLPKVKMVGCETLFSCNSMNDAKRESLLDALDQQLDRHDMAGIGYDVGKLGFGVAGQHASTIVGRRPRASGECDYLLRDNTGGKDLCAFYGNPLSMECDRPGYVWVPASMLKFALEQVVTLE